MAPSAETCQYYIIFSTYCSWLPGDPRGFRTRHHRVHVEGDYRNPPPSGAYERLHAHVKKRTPTPVKIPPTLRPIVGQACLEQFAKEGVEVVVMSVGGQHVHAAVLCSRLSLKQVVGRVKKVSSHRIRTQLPGRVWASGCKLVHIKNTGHWTNVLEYVRRHNGAWIWCAE